MPRTYRSFRRGFRGRYRRPRTVAGKAFVLAKRAMRRLRHLKPELKYVDVVSSASTEVGATLSDGGYPAGELAEPSLDLDGEYTAGPPTTVAVATGSFWCFSIVPVIASGGGDHGRIGDRIKLKWVNMRGMFYPPSNTPFSNDTAFVHSRSTATGVANAVSAVTKVGPARVRMLIIRLPDGNVDPTTASEHRYPLPQDLWEYVNQTNTGTHYSNVQYYTGSSRFWYPWTRKTKPSDFKVVWDKTYRLTKPTPFHVRVNLNKELEMTASSNRPLQENFYVMIINDTGQLPSDHPVALSNTYTGYDPDILVQLRARVTFEDF